MIDINAIINNAITNAVINTVNAAVAQATQPLVERINALEQQLSTIGVTDIINDAIDARVKAVVADHGPVVDMDALRELVTPLVGSMVEAKIEEAISAHCEEYDHDEYDRMLRTMEDHDFDDFVRSDELDSNVRDAVRDLTFEVSVS